MVVEPSDELISVAEAAKILQVSVPTVKRWLRDGRLPAYHLGPRYVRIRRADLQRVLRPLQPKVTHLNERPLDAGAPVHTMPPTEPLTDEQVAEALQAIKEADDLRAKMRARRGGKPLASSWPLLREAREQRQPSL
jgi:excisionase family DNA binding protein